MPENNPENNTDIALGLSASRSLIVDGPVIYSPSGKDEHRTLSSPAMIMEMELACVDAVREHLGEGESSVGFHVDVKHLAPALAGEEVITKATLVDIDGRKLRFQVDTRWGDTLIGTGIHRRAVVRL
jgi:fluoroacetyl-CoA thioesterase